MGQSEQQGFTFNEIAARRNVTRLGAYLKFKRNRDKLTEGTEYIIRPFHTQTIITAAGYAKLYPTVAAPVAVTAPAATHRYQFHMSVC